jgi:alpha-glucosidase
VFRSPMMDFGYDISDYRDVDPSFGSLAGLDALLREAHARDLKVILDFVPNHTSDQHPWFQESRSSRDNPRRDWYNWRDPAPDGGPPNNWLTNLGTGAWELDAQTGQYYYHAFLKQQPDLNWRNPDVREAMWDIMRFWLDRGFDGFRVDVIWQLVKDEHFRDNPRNPLYAEGMPPNRSTLPTYTTDQPEVHDIVAGMRRVIDEYEDRVLIGEIYLPVERLVMYYGSEASLGVHLPLNFHLLDVPWQADAVAELVNRYEALVPAYGWPNWVLGNHDKPRVASRLGTEQARLAAMLLLTLRGTPTLYYGDELGMTDVEVPPALRRDRFDLETPGLGRDGARTPMQWSSEVNAGFSHSTPWLPVGPEFATVNVDSLEKESGSILNLYRSLLQMRKREPALVNGDYQFIEATDVLTFTRAVDGRRLVVALNFSNQKTDASLPESGGYRVLLSTYVDRWGDQEDRTVSLRPNEGVVLG